MAFYGSPVANLSPILFRGNLFSEGVNVVFYSDISYSTSLPTGGRNSYLNFGGSKWIGGTSISNSIGVGHTLTIFYDGTFLANFQDKLVSKQIGSQQGPPNLYTYFDSNLRVKGISPTNQQIIENTETYVFDKNIILARESEGFGNYRDLKVLWSESYINEPYGDYNDTTNPFNALGKLNSSTTPIRLNSLSSLNK